MTLLKHMSISFVLTLTVQPLRQYQPQVQLYKQPFGYMHFLKWLHLLPEFVVIMDINAAVLSIAQKRFFGVLAILFSDRMLQLFAWHWRWRPLG